MTEVAGAVVNGCEEPGIGRGIAPEQAMRQRSCHGAGVARPPRAGEGPGREGGGQSREVVAPFQW